MVILTLISGILDQKISKKKFTSDFKKKLKEDIFRTLSITDENPHTSNQKYEYNYKKKLSYIIKAIRGHIKFKVFNKEELNSIKDELIRKILKQGGNYLQQDAMQNLKKTYLNGM